MSFVLTKRFMKIDIELVSEAFKHGTPADAVTLISIFLMTTLPCRTAEA